MGLTNVLAGATSSRAHVLIVEAPGAFRQRVALERALDRLGWCTAASVADADILAIVGEPGDALDSVVQQAWAQMSEPRVRLDLQKNLELGAQLIETRERLRDQARTLTSQDVRGGFTPSAHTGEASDASGHDNSAMSPDGIPLAEGAEDRDGLEMDELQLPLGPLLSHWPAGLVLRVTLRGDVVSAAQVEQLGADQGVSLNRDDQPTHAARLLDAAASVLTLTGLPSEAARVRRLRDQCLDGDMVDGSHVAELGERIGRQRMLRWVLRGLTIRGSHGGSQALHDRLTNLFERAGAELDGEARRTMTPGVHALPELIPGHELAAVRLWLAVLMPDLIVHGSSEAAHG